MWKNIANSVIRVMGKISKTNSFESSSINKLKHIINNRIEKTQSNEVPLPKETVKTELTPNNAPIREKKPKSVRYALMLAYQGKNYYGMQVS